MHQTDEHGVQEHRGASGAHRVVPSSARRGSAGLESSDVEAELADAQTERGHSKGGWGRRIFDASVGGLLVTVIALTLQIVDSAAVQRTWQRIRGVVTGQEPSTAVRGLPYSLNTAALPRKPIQIDTGGRVDQPFEAAAKHIDLIKLIIGRDDPTQGYADDAPIGRVRIQILDGTKTLYDEVVTAHNNTATSTQPDLAVQPGRQYVLRITNEERAARLGMYFTEEQRGPSAIIQERSDTAPYTYPHQLSASVRGHD
jgi:hypothetical protein